MQNFQVGLVVVKADKINSPKPFTTTSDFIAGQISEKIERLTRGVNMYLKKFKEIENISSKCKISSLTLFKSMKILNGIIVLFSKRKN